MEEVIPIKSKREAKRVLKENNDLVKESDIRTTVQNSLKKLNDVEQRIDEIENRGFFKRMIGGITGKNNRNMISAMRDLTEAQQLTIRLVLSLAVMHGQNHRKLNEILDELDNAKGTYTRLGEHIEFLYEQVELVKERESKSKKYSAINTNFGKIIVTLMIILSLFALNKFIF